MKHHLCVNLLQHPGVNFVLSPGNSEQPLLCPHRRNAHYFSLGFVITHNSLSFVAVGNAIDLSTISLLLLLTTLLLGSHALNFARGHCDCSGDLLLAIPVNVCY